MNFFPLNYYLTRIPMIFANESCIRLVALTSIALNVINKFHRLYLNYATLAAASFQLELFSVINLSRHATFIALFMFRLRLS